MKNFKKILAAIALSIVAAMALLSSALVQAQEVRTYYITDAVGSPVKATDAYGNVTWSEDYLPYGERRNRSASSGDNERWFTGAPQNEDTGLVDLGNRQYDPVVGRFLGIDPVGVFPGNTFSVNRYAYANNNPYRYIDPDGTYGRGSGFEDEKKWNIFNAAQIAYASKLERAAERADRAANNDPAAVAEFIDNFGVAGTAEMLRTAQMYRDMAGALLDDGSHGYMAQLHTNDEFTVKTGKEDINVAGASIPETRIIWIKTERLGEASLGHVIAHETAHKFGAHDETSGGRAYRDSPYADQVQRYKDLPKVNPRDARNNPDRLVNFAE